MYISYTPTIELREVTKFSMQFLFGDRFLNVFLITVLYLVTRLLLFHVQVSFQVNLHLSSNTGYLVTQPIRIAYFQHVIALDQSEGWI